MSKPYNPDWESHYFHAITAAERAKISAKVDALFRAQTGITRPVHRTSAADRELRRTWLRIRDAVMQDYEIEQQMEAQRRDFIEDLPGIVASDMRGQGWRTAARLMETWMTRPAAVMPRYSSPVTDIVTMDWVLKFKSARLVHDRIVKDRIWTNAASRRRLASILRKAPVAAGGRFGDLSKPATTVDAAWVNARPVNSYSDSMDIQAALGRFEFQVAVAGTVLAASPASVQILVTEIGVYVKDSYDFNGSQFLGFWGHRDMPVSNPDFREWRKLQDAGGDFLIYSDVRRTRLFVPSIVHVDLTQPATVP